ncbi:ThiF family adenylyltransferase [Microbacterium sp. NPDC055683]
MSLPALVAAGPALTAAQRERYARQTMLPGMGEEAQRRLLAARVLVVGAGGLGAPALLGLAAAGVGTLGIVDADTVEVSNLQRQLLHGVRDIGRLKVDSAREGIHAIDPAVVVETHAERLTAANAAAMLARYDLVVDGSDNFATRLLVDDEAARAGIPVVWGSVLRYEGQVSVFWGARGVRFRDLYPDVPDGAPDCATAGVLGPLCALVGAQLAAEAIKLVTGVGRTLLGRVVVVDALTAGWREVSLRAEEPAPSPSLVTAAALRAALDSARPPLVIDVRAPSEPGAVPTAVRWELDAIEAGEGEPSAVADALAAGREIVVHCAAGIRSATAAGILARRHPGHPIGSLAGGIAAWNALHDASRAGCAVSG